MAVTVTVGPTFTLNPGRVDPRFPLGFWFVDTSVTGDLSGGSVTLTILFRGSTESPLFLAFSLQFMSAGVRATAPNEGPRFGHSGFSLAGIEGSGLAMNMAPDFNLSGDEVRTLPWPQAEIFLGSPVRGSDANIFTRFATNTNGVVFDVRASGLMWLYEGMLEIGGVQPVTSSVPTVSAASSPAGSLQEVRSARVVKPEVVAAMTPATGQILAPGAAGFVGPVAISRPAVAARPTVTDRVTAGPSASTLRGRAASLAPPGFMKAFARKLREQGLARQALSLDASFVRAETARISAPGRQRSKRFANLSRDEIRIELQTQLALNRRR